MRFDDFMEEIGERTLKTMTLGELVLTKHARSIA